ncbi:MAG: 4-oxalocrotonate tautomerase [Chloroflexota bacterium]|nr:MAG: 4-oxalocrotonate tautomerase [Chloroflexota bacterium]
MALITIEGPQIRPPEYRKELVREITELAAQHWGIGIEEVVVLIKEQGGAHMRESAGSLARGGVLLSDE